MQIADWPILNALLTFCSRRQPGFQSIMAEGLESAIPSAWRAWVVVADGSKNAERPTTESPDKRTREPVCDAAYGMPVMKKRFELTSRNEQRIKIPGDRFTKTASKGSFHPSHEGTSPRGR